jgi:hypothetical protein
VPVVADMAVRRMQAFSIQYFWTLCTGVETAFLAATAVRGKHVAVYCAASVAVAVQPYAAACCSEQHMQRSGCATVVSEVCVHQMGTPMQFVS